MDLIKLYQDDQESDDPINPPKSLPNNNNNNNNLVANAAVAVALPIKVDIAPVKLEAHKPRNHLPMISTWLKDIDKQVQSCLGSIYTLQKSTILDSMDFFIRKLITEYKYLLKPRVAAVMSNYIRTYLSVFKYLYRTYDMGKRYIKRIIKILAIYTDLELCASILGTEYDFTVAGRIQNNYQTHLAYIDKNLVLDVFLNTKRIWRRHRGIMTLLIEHNLRRDNIIEMPDNLFMKHVIVYKKWLYLEELAEDKNKIQMSFSKFVKPKKTICLNSIFKPYLPVDEEGFATIDDSVKILDMEHPIGSLVRAVKKAEEYSQANAKEVVIVLTDDEDDKKGHKNDNCEPSLAFIDQDDFTNDFNMSSQSSHSSSHNEHFDTLSTATSQSISSLRKSGDESLDNVTTDTLISDKDKENSVDEINVNDNSEGFGVLLNRYQNYDNDSNRDCDDDLENNLNHSDLNGLLPLDPAEFDRLMDNMNATTLSAPSFLLQSPRAINSMEIQDNSISENESQFHSVASSAHNETYSKLPIIITQVYTMTDDISHTSICQLIRESQATSKNKSLENNTDAADDNHINEDSQVLNQEELSNCGMPAQHSIFQNHQQTLSNIEEIIGNDYDEINEESAINSDSNETLDLNDSELNTTTNNENEDGNASVQFHHYNQAAEESVPLHPTTSTIPNLTDLLSQSEQELIFSESVPINDTFPWTSESFNNLTVNAAFQTPTILPNPNDSKTKARNRRPQNKTLNFKPNQIMPQHSLEAKQVHNESVNDENQFLMDIFCSTQVQQRTQNSSSEVAKNTKMFSSSTPKPLNNEVPAENTKKRRGRKPKTALPEAEPTVTQLPKGKRGRKSKNAQTAVKQIVPKAKSERKSGKRPNTTSNSKKQQMSLELLALNDSNPTTILKRQNYIKPLNDISYCDNNLSDNENDNDNVDVFHMNSSPIKTYSRKTNGKPSSNNSNSSSNYTSTNNGSVPNTMQSTILERKTYVKPPSTITTTSSTSIHSQSLFLDRQQQAVEKQPSDGNSINLFDEPVAAEQEPNQNQHLKNPNVSEGEYSNGQSLLALDPLTTAKSQVNESSVSKKSRLSNNEFDSINDSSSDWVASTADVSDDYLNDSSEFDDSQQSDLDNTRKSRRHRKRPKKLNL